MNNLIYATTFRNEGLAGESVRLPPIKTAGTFNNTLDTDGYNLSLSMSAAQNWALQPQVSTSERYLKYVFTIVRDTNSANLVINAFGVDITPLLVLLDPSIPVTGCVVVDTQEEESHYYTQGLVAHGNVITQELKFSSSSSTSTFTGLIKDLMVVESDDDFPVDITITENDLSSVTNEGWSFTGNSLEKSIVADSVLDTDPYAFTDDPDDYFEIGTDDSATQFVEFTGYANFPTNIKINNQTILIDDSRSAQSLLLGSTDSVRIQIEE